MTGHSPNGTRTLQVGDSAAMAGARAGRVMPSAESLQAALYARVSTADQNSAAPRIRNHPLIPKSIPIYGYIYNVRTGKLEEAPGATTVGKAS